MATPAARPKPWERGFVAPVQGPKAAEQQAGEPSADPPAAAAPATQPSATPAAASSAPASGSPPLTQAEYNSDPVGQAVRFLAHPGVANAPLSAKRAFLESKHLTAWVTAATR